MADQKISELTALTGANVADDDAIAIVDTSATETKKIVFSELKNALDTATGFVRITGDTMTGDLNFGDNDKAIFGAGSDLQIYHDTSSTYGEIASVIADTGSGPLKIAGGLAGRIELVNSAGDLMLKAVGQGEVNLYHNNSPKLATTSTGIDVTGTITADGLTVDGNSIFNVDTGGYLAVSGNEGQDAKLVIQSDQGDNSQDITTLIQAEGGDFTIATQNGVDRINIGATTGDISFYEDTGTTPKLFWDASEEALKIGTANPQAVNAGSFLSVGSATGGEILAFRDDGIVAVDDFAGAFLIGNRDSSGTPNHFAGMWADLADTFGRMDLHFSAGRDVYEAGNSHMTIGKTGNVGIGTDSPRVPIDVAGAGATTGGVTSHAVLSDTASFAINKGGLLSFEGKYNTAGNPASWASIGGLKENATDGNYAGYLQFNTRANGANQAEAMRIDSSGNVGIGTADPDAQLTILGEAQTYNFSAGTDPLANFAIINDNLNAGTGASILLGSTYLANGADVANARIFAERQSTGSTNAGAANLVFEVGQASGSALIEAMRIDSSGNVGIGTTSPDRALHVNTSQDYVAKFSSSDAGAAILLEDSNSTANYNRIGVTTHDMQFVTNNSEAMRIDSSGNLLVGTTETYPGAGTAENRIGISIENTYGIHASTNGQRSLLLNRMTSDGTIADFRKDGATVGSIGVEGGDLVIGTGTNCGLQFNDGNTAIRPFNMASNAPVDNAVDLGISSTRFKDLFLSGGVYLGGIGAANKLDDYEEGTWTPDVVGTTTAGAGTYNSRAGTYTKIGDRVLFNCWINMSAHTGSGNLAINGLPFTSASGNNFHSLNAQYSSALTAPAGSFIVGMLFNSSSQIALYSIPTGTTTSTALALDTAFVLNISGQYLVS